MLVPNGISRVARASASREPKAIADTRTIDAREALLLEPLRELHRGLSTPGHRGQAHGRLCRHRHLQGDWHIMGTPEDTR